MAQSKVHRVLENPNSTCYLNAVLQTLFMTKEFKEHVMRDSSGDNFIKELKDLFNKLKEQQKTAVSAAEVTKSLGIINVDEQADAAEILHFIIKKTPGSSEFFKGTMKTTRSCRTCRHKHESFENLLSLIVSFKASQDVEDAVQAHIDQMCGEYQMTCFRCKSNTVWKKKSEMIIFPKILIIQLERFEMDSSGFRKNDLKVKICPRIKATSHEYDLYAIVNHYGLYEAGHYNADIKCGKIWRRFDDHGVSKSDMNESSTHSSDAYLLMYRRKE